MISDNVAPLARPIIARIFAPLLSARGALACFALAGLAAFLPAVASFFGAAALVFRPLAVFRPSRAPFFLVAAFFEEAFSDATFAPCSATVADLSFVFAFVIRHPFLRSVSALRFIAPPEPTIKFIVSNMAYCSILLRLGRGEFR